MQDVQFSRCVYRTKLRFWDFFDRYFQMEVSYSGYILLVKFRLLEFNWLIHTYWSMTMYFFYQEQVGFQDSLNEKKFIFIMSWIYVLSFYCSALYLKRILVPAGYNPSTFCKHNTNFLNKKFPEWERRPCRPQGFGHLWFLLLN